MWPPLTKKNLCRSSSHQVLSSWFQEVETHSNGDEERKSNLSKSQLKKSVTSLCRGTSDSSVNLGRNFCDRHRIVIYFTSLRVIRRTFEDCQIVRSILGGFRVTMDERDLSMDAGFLADLRDRLDDTELALPRVFIGGRYIGGADDIVYLHEIGELNKIIQGFPQAAPDVCHACGGVRFVLCYECYGGQKIHLDDGGFMDCDSCNENGLLRCPSCCS